MNDPIPKKLTFDWRYGLAFLAVLFFVNIAGSFLATFVKFGIPESMPTQQAGLTQAYTIVLPLNYLAFMVTTTIALVIIAYAIEQKRAYLFRAEASNNAMLVEQIAASSILILTTIFAFLRSGTYNAVTEYLGGFLSFIFGFIDKNTFFDEIFFERVLGGSVIRPHSFWLVPLCLIITFTIWNVALYYTRLYATKKGYAKRAAERDELYRESEAKKG